MHAYSMWKSTYFLQKYAFLRVTYTKLDNGKVHSDQSMDNEEVVSDNSLARRTVIFSIFSNLIFFL